MTFNINTNCELCGCYVYYNEEFCEICKKTIKDAREQKEYLEKLKKDSESKSNA